MKNSRHKGQDRFGQVAFYPQSWWPSIKKKTLSPAPYAPPRLKHSRTTRELVCRLCAPSSLHSLSHADKRFFSLLVSRDKSRNEAPSIVQLIFHNFSKKKRKKQRGETSPTSPLKTTHPQRRRKARGAPEKGDESEKKWDKVRDREKREKVREKKNNLLYTTPTRCNGGYFALQNTRSTPVPTSPPTLSPLVIPATPRRLKIIYLSFASARKKTPFECDESGEWL